MAFIACWAFCFQLRWRRRPNEWCERVSESKQSSGAWKRHEYQTLVCVSVPSPPIAHSSKLAWRKCFFRATKMKSRWRWRWWWRWRWRWQKMKWNETERIWVYNIFSVFSWEQSVFVRSQHRFPLHLHHIRFLFVCAVYACDAFTLDTLQDFHCEHIVVVVSVSFSLIHFFSHWLGVFLSSSSQITGLIGCVYRSETRTKSAVAAKPTPIPISTATATATTMTTTAARRNRNIQRM